jgi:hypothetical protein
MGCRKRKAPEMKEKDRSEQAILFSRLNQVSEK